MKVIPWAKVLTIFYATRVYEQGRDSEEYDTVIKHTGEVAWYFLAVLHSSCPLDMTKYPWDNQSCKLKFGSWIRLIKELDLIPYQTEKRKNSGDLSEFQGDSQWDVIDFPMKRKEEKYAGQVRHLIVEQMW